MTYKVFGGTLLNQSIITNVSYTVYRVAFTLLCKLFVLIKLASYSSNEPYCLRWEVCEVRCSRAECIPGCSLFSSVSSSDHALQNTRRHIRSQDHPFSSPPQPTACASVSKKLSTRHSVTSHRGPQQTDSLSAIQMNCRTPRYDKFRIAYVGKWVVPEMRSSNGERSISQT